MKLATTTSTDPSAVAELRHRHRGPVIGPDDDGYEAARATFNGLLDRRPALVARPVDVSDVVTAVSFAVEADLPIAVRGGGHGVAGHCVGDGSLVVDLRLMRDVTVDPDARAATCGGGALWEDLDPPCQRHGLATPGGTFGDTGVAGLTLGGGIGHLIGLHGLTLDNLLAATVVTADGSVVRASEDEHDALFWALRGGGGNFGVVVDFTFRLHPVGLLLGGLLHYRLEDAAAILSVWRELMADAPDNLACFPLVYRSQFRGAAGVMVSAAYFGEPEEGRAAIRELANGEVAPTHDAVRPMYYSELQEIFGRMAFGLRNYWSGRFLRDLPDEAIELVSATFANPDAYGTVLIEPLHGAAGRVPPEETAFAGREARYNNTFVGTWEDPAEDEHRIRSVRAYSAALAPWTVGGGYLNYASEMAGDGLETEYGAERFARLQSVKRQYDPENRFRFNHNIPPG
jgi:FAD/FMN-containing dehydrogenase